MPPHLQETSEYPPAHLDKPPCPDGHPLAHGQVSKEEVDLLLCVFLQGELPCVLREDLPCCVFHRGGLAALAPPPASLPLTFLAGAPPLQGALSEI